jgi:hypothetical protein
MFVLQLRQPSLPIEKYLRLQLLVFGSRFAAPPIRFLWNARPNKILSPLYYYKFYSCQKVIWREKLKGVLTWNQVS